MKPLRAIGNFFRRAYARFESAIQKWGERSWIIQARQDARKDIDHSNRAELVRRSRYWEQNNAVANRLSDLFEQYTVGPSGLQIVPNSSSTAYNQAATDWWKQWARYPALDSKQPLSILETLIARTWFFDGEIFIYKTYSKETGRPRIQLIEEHRIMTPPQRVKDEGDSIVDGVEIDRSGRPIGYWHHSGDGKDASDFDYIKAENMIHVFEPGRAGQYRGLPFLYAVMNDLHDLDDLQILEMRAAKDAAQVTNVIINASGEVSAARLRRTNFNIQSTDQNNTPVTKNASEYYDTILGGRSIALKKGEDIKQFSTNRPSVTTREYWDYLVAKVCAGVGISRLLVFPYSMQGTVTRADLDVSAAFFRSRSEVIATALREIYEFVMKWAVTYDPALDGYPTDWFKAIVRPPRAVNVDVGRNSSAILAELDAGTRTYQDVYAEKGEDWMEQLEQKAKERAFIHAMALKYSTADAPLSADEIAGTEAESVEPDPQERNVSTSPATTATP